MNIWRTLVILAYKYLILFDMSLLHCNYCIYLQSADFSVVCNSEYTMNSSTRCPVFCIAAKRLPASRAVLPSICPFVLYNRTGALSSSASWDGKSLLQRRRRPRAPLLWHIGISYTIISSPAALCESCLH